MKYYRYEDLLAFMGVGGAHPGGMGLTKNILSGVSLGPDSEVLEVGCGIGETSSHLTQTYGCKVTAIEKNPIMLEKAFQRFRRENIHVKLMKGCAEKLPFKKASFDLVVVESVTIFTDIAKALREYNRVLRPGAVLIDLEMTAEVPLQPVELNRFKSVYGLTDVPTQQRWLDLLKESGFNFITILNGGSMVSSSVYQSEYSQDLKLDLSPLLNPQLLNIYNEHLQLQAGCSNLVGYRVYWAKRL